MENDPVEFNNFNDYNYFCNIKIYMLTFAVTVIFLIMFITTFNIIPLFIIIITSAFIIYFSNNVCEYFYKNAWSELKSYGYNGDNESLSKAKELYYKNKINNQKNINLSSNRNNFSIRF